MNRELVMEFLTNGYNCSQSVLCYFAEEFNLDHLAAKRIAEAFESGQFKGTTCGAVSGAYMVLGLKYGSDEPEHRQTMEEKVNKFNKLFKENCNSTLCRDLLGEDISTKDGLEKIINQGLLEKVCPNAIFTSIKILEKI